jgi:hypothetical protein
MQQGGQTGGDPVRPLYCHGSHSASVTVVQGWANTAIILLNDNRYRFTPTVSGPGGCICLSHYGRTLCPYTSITDRLQPLDDRRSHGWGSGARKAALEVKESWKWIKKQLGESIMTTKKSACKYCPQQAILPTCTLPTIAPPTTENRRPGRR